MKEVFSFLKPIVSTLIIIGLLQVTGLWSSASSLAQSLVLKTGALNADSDFKKPIGAFDYQFDMLDMHGNPISAEKLKGKVVFLNLWATWCGPCKAEMPGIDNLYQKLKEYPIEFVILSVDKANAQSKIETYLSKNNYSFPVYMLQGVAPELLQVPSIPTTYVINKEGKVVLKEIGARNYDTKKMANSLIELSTQ
ncbi:MAG: TlpA family protein disulfide reductase [Cyclobacteriaceae bacterium]|jgi:thiol-disulfide isomerase/thioredoxin|nr:TlpA family protein disulfide reductase [Cyclobacteriaceae bacterium]